MQTDLFAGLAGTEAMEAVEDDRVTSMLAKLLPTSGDPTKLGGTNGSLTYGSLVVDHSESGAMVTRQLSPWNLYSPGAALQQAMEDVRVTPDTPISGAPVILVFATSSWRLLIASVISSSPSLWGGEHFVFGQPEMVRTLSAKLLAQPQTKADSNCSVLRAWRAAALATEDEVTSLFLSTVLQLSSTPSINGSKASQ